MYVGAVRLSGIEQSPDVLFSLQVAMLIVGRLINGFGAGQLTAVFPVYASEIAPPAIRGALGMLQMVRYFTAACKTRIIMLTMPRSQLGIELAIFLATATGYGFGTHYTTTVQWCVTNTPCPSIFSY